MTALLDNITAAMVGMSVLAMVVLMNHRAQEAAVQRTVTYAVKKHALAFGEWIEADISNIGAGVGFGNDVITAHEENNAGFTTEFSFLRKMKEEDDDPVEVSYILVTRNEDVHTGKQYYRVERRIDGKVTGSSIQNITAFHVDMLDDTGAVTDDRSEARQIQVRFSNAMPLPGEKRRKRFIHETHWSTVFQLRDMNAAGV